MVDFIYHHTIQLCGSCETLQNLFHDSGFVDLEEKQKIYFIF